MEEKEDEHLKKRLSILQKRYLECGHEVKVYDEIGRFNGCSKCGLMGTIYNDDSLSYQWNGEAILCGFKLPTCTEILMRKALE